ncbi:RNA-directed DNA polymerase [Gossypium australe]|uniref:RNA-directed DNA polymerase n=1 Tax=Gossypium australe TaxID=47621 RepID=A0A5B6WLQ2_9ROSI|nr:RNA-directed DNA polymerase [Gossypium australe]
MKQYLIELLQEFKDAYAWSYQDMLGLSTDVVEECKPVQQKLRRMRLDVLLKIKEEVKKQFDTKWVANIVPVPKKDGKV